ncbi:exported protein of unknown function [Candidatus Methylocalor cossyra]|uniref:Uncharacterized protein n=1 Tax=Candidatus Methylocalor cossyra TaxID=3108543 RepID=A0ABM9NJV2_9GAMM
MPPWLCLPRRGLRRGVAPLLMAASFAALAGQVGFLPLAEGDLHSFSPPPKPAPLAHEPARCFPRAHLWHWAALRNPLL